jgi:GAF domain-containing protein
VSKIKKNPMNTEVITGTNPTGKSALSNYAVNPQVNEKQFDEFTMLIANLCDMPKALIALVDGEKLWFKSNLGMPVNYVPYVKSYCQFTIANEKLTEFSDIEKDATLAKCSWTNDYPQIKFYAGVPLITEDGGIGTLCIMDSVPHILTDKQKEILISLGQMVSSLMESRRDLLDLQERKKTAANQTVSLRAMRSITRSW